MKAKIVKYTIMTLSTDEQYNKEEIARNGQSKGSME